MDSSNPFAGVQLSGSDPMGSRQFVDPERTNPGRSDRPALVIRRSRRQGRILCLASLMPTFWWVAGCGRSEAPAPVTVPVTRQEPKAPAPSAPVAAKDGVVASVPATEPMATVAAGPDATPGRGLYVQYCAACHGENGDGNGGAARFLYPKPRNFRDGQYRMVSAVNRLPTDDDLMRVILRGMPGSAMLPVAAHLGEADRRALVAYVRELTRQGIEAHVRNEAKEFGEEFSPEDLQKRLATHATPGAVLEMPGDLPSADGASVARGRDLYVKGCATCHGDTGKGDGVQEQKDESGVPIRPRDLTLGIFKGGRSREQLYARITLGIPGTPMPSSPALSPAEVGDMINYILSLSDEATTARSEHKRNKLVAKKLTETLPDTIPAAVWDGTPATELVVSPLWWRDQADPELRVQAVHDGQALAIRMSWRDDSRNDQSGHLLDFPDMAAVELYKGAIEPFLGMGATEGAVDVWLWNAAAQADRKSYADVDTAHPNMVVDMYPFEKPGEGARAHPTDRQPREFLTAWAAGNLRSDPTHPPESTHLQAKGFGSTTMRPKTSQVVQASGEYNDRRWTVVLRRPLKIAADAGLEIATGDAFSIAFALWEGSVRDRNGQKLVSIWHDLKIE